MGFIRRPSLLLLAIGAALFTDCSKTDPAPPLCYLTVTTTVIGTGVGDTEELSYDDQHRVVKVTKTFSGTSVNVSTYTYDSNGNLTTINNDNGSTTTYTYDSQGRMVVTTYSSGSTDTFTYNATNQVITQVYDEVGCSTCSNTLTFTYPNTTTHNFSGISSVSGNGTSLTATFEYDNHPNPNKVFRFGSGLTDNNITKITQTNSSGVQTVTFSYTYNERGYPLTSVSTIGASITYTYNCP